MITTGGFSRGWTPIPEEIILKLSALAKEVIAARQAKDEEQAKEEAELKPEPMHTIEFPKPIGYRFNEPQAGITKRACDACRLDSLCLVTDNSEGEYRDIALCFACIGKAFAEVESQPLPIPIREKLELQDRLIERIMAAYHEVCKEGDALRLERDLLKSTLESYVEIEKELRAERDMLAAQIRG
jgi:hypothetical protein